MRIVDMDLYRMNVYVIQTQLETHTKFVVQWKEIHVQTRNVELEQSVVKQTMVAWNAFVQLVTLAIHLWSVVIWTNVWTIHAEQIQFVSIPPVDMTANVNVDSLVIHSQCVHQFRVISNVTIQVSALAVNQLLVQLDIDVKMEDV